MGVVEVLLELCNCWYLLVYVQPLVLDKSVAFGWYLARHSLLDLHDPDIRLLWNLLRSRWIRFQFLVHQDHLRSCQGRLKESCYTFCMGYHLLCVIPSGKMTLLRHGSDVSKRFKRKNQPCPVDIMIKNSSIFQ